MPSQPFSFEVTNVTIVVRDIARTLQNYVDIFGIDPSATIFVDPDEAEDQGQTWYHGQLTEGKAKVAFLPLGSVQIELKEPAGGPSIWQDFLRTNGEGIHNIVLRVNNLPQATAFLAEQGVPLLQESEYADLHEGCLDARSQLGMFLGLLQFKG